jgi:HK97 family phage prohead protease
MADTSRLSRGEIGRAMPGGYELARAQNGGPRRLAGYFAVFNEWTEINSRIEGHFMEQIIPGAFAKTISERGDRIRLLLEHGLHPQLGKSPIGKLTVIREDNTGGYFEAELFPSVPELVIEGLEAGEYGASFWFGILHANWEQRPAKSQHNPYGIPEQSLTELMLKEFGPVTFPEYEGAKVGVRSVTDEAVLHSLAADSEWFTKVVEREGLEVVASEDTRRSRTYTRAAQAVGDSVWAIHPAALVTILQIIGERRAGYRPTEEEIRDRIGTRAEAAEREPGPVAVIPINGPIFPKANLMTEMSGATSLEQVRAQFRDAVADENTAAIVLDIDSPGGVVDLVPEFAAEIRDARGAKPIVAVANAMAASAAYWIATAADELVVTPSGDVGSIGVWSAHADISKLEEKAGIKTTLVSAGKYKTERNPYEPLSDEAQAEMQRKTDAYYAMFVAAVAKGRDVPVKTVRTGFGEGRMVLAEDAVARGMADRVGTLDQTITRLEKTVSRQADTKEQTAKLEPESSEATTPQQRPEPEPSKATTQRPQFRTREEWLQWISET